jgi:hypothetical protein
MLFRDARATVSECPVLFAIVRLFDILATEMSVYAVFLHMLLVGEFLYVQWSW